MHTTEAVQVRPYIPSLASGFMNLSSLPNHYTQSMRCQECTPISYSSTPFKPAIHWVDYESRAIAVLRKSPRSAEIFSVEFMELQFKEGPGRDGFSHSCGAFRNQGICRPLSQYLREQIESALENVSDNQYRSQIHLTI